MCKVVTLVKKCVYTVSFVALVNGSATRFFKPSKGLQQGCPLAPLLFLIVEKVLIRALVNTKRIGVLKGIKIGSNNLSHLLFVDNILLFCDDSKQDVFKLKEVLDLYFFATGILVIIRKSYISLVGMEKEKDIYFTKLFMYQQLNWKPGLKYHCFTLKPKDYEKKGIRYGLFEKLRRDLIGCNHWLSWGGRVILVKSMIVSIPM